MDFEEFKEAWDEHIREYGGLGLLTGINVMSDNKHNIEIFADGYKLYNNYHDIKELIIFSVGNKDICYVDVQDIYLVI